MENDRVSDEELLVVRDNKRYGENMWMDAMLVRG